MKRWIVPLIVAVLVVCLAATVFVQTEEPDRCPLCEFIKSHAPCIVNIETGEVVELALYQPHYSLVGEIAELQTDSTFSFVSAAGAKGTRISSPYKMELDVPKEAEPLRKTAFCKSCRTLLTGAGSCYVLADLYDRGNPVIYPIVDGLDVKMRCYEATAVYDAEEKDYDLLLIGTYHD